MTSHNVRRLSVAEGGEKGEEQARRAAAERAETKRRGAKFRIMYCPLCDKEVERHVRTDIGPADTGLPVEVIGPMHPVCEQSVKQRLI